MLWLPVSSFRVLSIAGKRAIAGIPVSWACFAVWHALSMDWRVTPGMEVMGWFLFVPSMTKSGNIRSEGVRWFCATISRIQPVLRKRRMRMGRAFAVPCVAACVAACAVFWWWLLLLLGVMMALINQLGRYESSKSREYAASKFRE